MSGGFLAHLNEAVVCGNVDEVEAGRVDDRLILNDGSPSSGTIGIKGLNELPR
jgi:hypothetical protein